MSLSHPSTKMLTFIFGDLVLNEMRAPLMSQPMGELRKWLSWALVASVNMPLYTYCCSKLQIRLYKNLTITHQGDHKLLYIVIYQPREKLVQSCDF